MAKRKLGYFDKKESWKERLDKADPKSKDKSKSDKKEKKKGK